MLQQQLLSETQGQVGRLRQVSSGLVKGRSCEKKLLSKAALWERDVGNGL